MNHPSAGVRLLGAPPEARRGQRRHKFFGGAGGDFKESVPSLQNRALLLVLRA